MKSIMIFAQVNDFTTIPQVDRSGVALVVRNLGWCVLYMSHYLDIHIDIAYIAHITG